MLCPQAQSGNPFAPRRGRFALKGTAWTRQDQRHCAAVQSFVSFSFRSFHLLIHSFGHPFRFASLLLPHSFIRTYSAPLRKPLHSPVTLTTLTTLSCGRFAHKGFTPSAHFYLTAAQFAAETRHAQKRTDVGTAGEPPRAARLFVSRPGQARQDLVSWKQGEKQHAKNYL